VRRFRPASTALTVHVRVFTVSLSDTKKEEMLPLFVRCVFALTNLHTLEIPHAHRRISASLASALGKRTLLGIRRLVLPDCAHPLLRACPEAREVVCIMGNGAKLLGVIAKNCPHVERVDGVSLWPSSSVKREL
jgi:hypothetical protein